jgi:hypothetical protein
LAVVRHFIGGHPSLYSDMTRRSRLTFGLERLTF